MSKSISNVSHLILMAASLFINSLAFGQENSGLESTVLDKIAQSRFSQSDDGMMDWFVARLGIEENLQMFLWKTSNSELETLNEQLKSLTLTRESIVENKLGGLEIDRKTIQSLVANAHFELQRLEWEANAETSTKPKDSESIEVKILKLQISGIQSDLKSADQLVEIAQAAADRAAKSASKGNMSDEELMNTKGKLVAQLAEQAKLKNELELLLLKIEEIISTPAIEKANRVSNTLARKKTIEEQLAKYAAMRKTLPELEAIDQQIDALQSSIHKAQQNTSEHQSNLDSAKVLSMMLESANQKLKERIKEAEDKKKDKP